MEDSTRISGTSQPSLQEWIRTADNSPIEVDPNPGDEPSFTFITHNDDLQSKRISDSSARKQIRSHVMRDVRRRERIAGLRRPSKKERIARGSQKSEPIGPDAKYISSLDPPANAPEDKGCQTGKVPISKPPVSDRRLSLQRFSSVVEDPGSSPPRLQLHSAPASIGPHEQQLPTPLITSTPGARFGDPFGTLPGAAGPSRAVDLLLKHCVEIFLPMTFPMERKSLHLMHSRVQKLMQLQINDVASFYGTMAMTAAHRAMVRGRILDAGSSNQIPQEIPMDPDYYVMHELALKEVNRKMQDPSKALAMDTFMSVMVLVGTATIVGNFREARLHLDGLVRMAALRRGVLDCGTDSSSPFWNMLLSDIKAAAGMGSRPRLSLTSPCNALEESLRLQIEPPPSSDLHMFSQNFSVISALSPRLQGILQSTKDLCFFDDYNSSDPDGLDPAAHDIFRRRTLTLEYALVSYVYEQFSTVADDPDKLQIPFLESVTRLAALTYFSSRFIVSGPSSGLGRSLTRQLYGLLMSLNGRYSDFSLQILELLVWVSFMGLHGAPGQKEEPYFYNHLSYLLSLVRWRDWSDLEGAMKGYLYESRVFGSSWKAMFDRVQVGVAGLPIGV